jgi:nucleotide-binding universal stress UspA family protein
MKILCPTDFSPCSRVATRLARALARRRGDTLLLIHSVEPPLIDAPGAPTPGGGWEQLAVNQAEAELKRLAAEASAQGVASVETQVTFGRPAPQVLALARDPEVALIVVGTHGRKGGARMFLGSCAEEVVREGHKPVLVVREDVADWTRWEGETPLRLTLATDGSPASDAAVYWVRSIAPALPNEISLVRVYWPPEEANRYGIQPAWVGDEANPELVGLLERDVRHHTAALAGAYDPPLRFRISSRHTGESLVNDAREMGADALVLGLPKRGWTGWGDSAPGPLLRTASLPVFCIPESARPEPRRVPRLRSLLIASDLSKRSASAVLQGYGLLPGGGRVELCHVHERSPSSPTGDLPLRSALATREREEVEERVRAQCPAESAEYGIVTRVHVLEGTTAAEAILQAAERLEVDAVVLGSRGRTGLARAVLGSVAETVARQSPRPVFIVPER